MNKTNYPNRKLPVSLKLNLYLNKALFWVLFSPFILGSVMSMILIPRIDFTEFFFYHRSIEEVTGIITDATVTNYLRMNDEGQNHIYKFESKYRVNGKEYTTLSYSNNEKFKLGDSATIQVIRSSPHISRIKGMRAKPYSWFTAFVLLVPIVSVIIMRMSFKESRRTLKLARNGIFTYAIIEKMEETNDFHDDDRYYKVHFTFTTSSGEKVDTFFETYMIRSFEVNKKVRIIVDPKNPKEAVFEEFLPEAFKAFLSNDNKRD